MKRLLPLGSVIRLEDSMDEKVLIIGRLIRSDENSEDVWDYLGVKVPEGVDGSQELLYFNQKDIKQIVFIGLQDEDELSYCYYLSQVSEKIQPSV